MQTEQLCDRYGWLPSQIDEETAEDIAWCLAIINARDEISTKETPNISNRQMKKSGLNG